MALGNLQSYAEANTGFNALTNEQAQFNLKNLLEALWDRTYFLKYGETITIPRNAGAKVSARRMEMPTPVTAAITEGTTPNAIDLTINEVNSTVGQLGAWVKITDYMMMAGLDKVLAETTTIFGDHAGLSMDKVVRDIIFAGTNIMYGGDATQVSELANGDVLDYTMIQRVREQLVRDYVKQRTLPDGGKGWIWFVDPEEATRVMALDEWKDQNTYLSVENRKKGIIGQIQGLYFVECTNMPAELTNGGGGTIHYRKSLVIGANAYAIPDIAGSAKPEILVYRQGSTENPMNLYATAAWKACFTAMILNQKCIMQVRCASADA